MNITFFNICIALGWAFATAGAMVLNIGAGLLTGGLLMMGITLLLARIGGLHGGRG